MTAVPESMITWSGTRHKVGEWNVRGWYGAACSGSYYLEPSHQPPSEFARPHRRDCKRCFPTAESDIFTDLERARDVAVALEQQDARLRRRIGELLSSDDGVAVHENTSEGTRFVNTLRQILLAGDAP